MFKPEDLKPVATLSFESTTRQLDKLFRDLVAEGWWSNNFRDHITVNISRVDDNDLYVSVIALSYEVIQYYSEAGWVGVEVRLSEDCGERPGLVSVKLIKKKGTGNEN